MNVDKSEEEIMREAKERYSWAITYAALIKARDAVWREKWWDGGSQWTEKQLKEMKRGD